MEPGDLTYIVLEGEKGTNGRETLILELKTLSIWVQRAC